MKSDRVVLTVFFNGNVHKIIDSKMLAGFLFQHGDATDVTSLNVSDFKDVTSFSNQTNNDPNYKPLGVKFG